MNRTADYVCGSQSELPFTNIPRIFIIPLMVYHPFNIKQSGNPLMYRQVLPGTIKYRCEDLTVPTPIETPDKQQEISEIELDPIAALESVLFLAKEPVSSRKLTQLADLPEGTQTRQLINELNKRYDRVQSAFYIVEVAEGFQLRTRPELAAWLVRMQGVPSPVRLSNPAMETLTVIAYRQPIPRAEVERIRGVQCGDLIKQLLDQDLARIVGRSEELGRPFLYGTTTKFLKIFGLGSLSDLPSLL